MEHIPEKSFREMLPVVCERRVPPGGFNNYNNVNDRLPKPPVPLIEPSKIAMGTVLHEYPMD